MKKAIINLSTKKFRKGQYRLLKSLKGKTNAEIFFYRLESQVGAPSHKDNNYAFKVYTFLKAIKEGFTHILWLDASMFVIKDIEPVFDVIDKEGYFFQNGGWKNSEWTNERAIEYFGTSEGDMMAACVLGLNLENEKTREFFDLWIKSMNEGIFNGDWSNHRHDQTCASILAYKLGMPLYEANSLFEYGKANEDPSTDKIVMKADGIC